MKKLDRYFFDIQLLLEEELGIEIFRAFEDNEVIEIILNEDGNIWLDSFKGMYKYSTLSSSKADNLMRTLASLNNIDISASNPDLATELFIQVNGQVQRYRFQGLLPPIVSAPIFSIRKPASKVFTLDDYIENTSITPEQKTIIQDAVKAKYNILIAGGTGSGKTTLANAILDDISKQFPLERVLILEDNVELQCNLENKSQLRSNNNRSLDDLLKYSLRLRPDRIIVGEVRGKEAYSLIKAWNTGHPGGIATIHANNANMALKRLHQLTNESGNKINEDVINEAINMVLYIEKNSKGKRVLKEIRGAIND